MIRVAFTLIGGNSWTGGHNYLRNLLEVLTRYQAQALMPILFVGEDNAEAAGSFRAISGVDVVYTPCLNSSHRKLALMQSLIWGKDRCMATAFKAHQIDLVFESAQFFGWRLEIPALAWIPDLQHRCLPHLFTRAAWWKREIGFRAQVIGGRTIMLSSDDARRACERYYPATRGATRTVHFAVPPREPIDYATARSVADGYNLPEQFLFMPNQFWRHKNHELVLEALSIASRDGKHIVIAASGIQNDPRDSDYFPRFLAALSKNGLQQSFRLLGLIPYSHLVSLMRCCTAMLNPSLFEGWSTTVEEARAMGTPMILSDLEVHREQMGNQAIYFDRHSAQSLAEVLASIPEAQSQQREMNVEHARTDAAKRVRRFAQDFVDLATYCVRQRP